MSIPIYLMTAMGPKSNIAVEGATKLFFFGTVSTVLIIFCCTKFWYDKLTLISFDNSLSSDVLSILSFFSFLINMFKTGLIPMHFWLSDTYQSHHQIFFLNELFQKFCNFIINKFSEYREPLR